MLKGIARSFGYRVVEPNFPIYSSSLAAGGIAVLLTKTVIVATGAPFGAVMFPVVAVMAHRVCVRTGIVTALVCMVGYNFFCTPPTLEFTIPTVREAIFYGCLLLTALVVAPLAPPQTPPRLFDKDDDLPFTSRKKPDSDDSMHHSKLFWDVEPTGDWAYDTQTGEEYARLWIERTRANDRRPPLAWIVGDMVAGGHFGGTEIGFVQRLGRMCAHCGANGTESTLDNNADNGGAQQRVL